METRSLRLNRALPGAGLLLAYVLMIQLAGCAHAQSVKLAWDPNPESSLAGYNVYRSEQSEVFTSLPINGATLVRRTSFTDSTVQPSRTYYYVVTAVSTGGLESAYSNQVQAIIGPVTVTNQAPVINAAADQTITLPSSATLSATATDDGLPNGILTYQWSVVSGSGVVFSSPASASTQALFSTTGTYTLRVTVSDGQLSSSDDLIVDVKPKLTTGYVRIRR